MATKTNLDPTKTYQKLSILITQNGLSFLYLNQSNIEYHDYLSLDQHQELHIEIEEKLKDYLQNLNYKQIKKVDLIYCNQDYNLIPKELAEPQQTDLAHAAKYSIELTTSDNFSVDYVFNEEVAVAFIPFINVNNLLFDLFGSFNHTHHISNYLNASSTYQNLDLYCIAFINRHSLDIFIIDNSKLLLGNSFEISSEEDIMYYLLYCLEVNEIDRKKVETNLMCLSSKYSIGKLEQLIELYISHFTFKNFSKEEDSYNPYFNQHKFINDICE